MESMLLTVINLESAQVERRKRAHGTNACRTILFNDMSLPGEREKATAFVMHYRSTKPVSLQSTPTLTML